MMPITLIDKEGYDGALGMLYLLRLSKAIKLPPQVLA
jgi:hypothetical protein